MIQTPAEVWCSKCAEPSTVERDGAAYCARHDPASRSTKPWDQPHARVAAIIGSAATGEASRRRVVPDAITDPWLRRQFAQAVGVSLQCDDCGRDDGSHNLEVEH